jgi:hypothetical protein
MAAHQFRTVASQEKLTTIFSARVSDHDTYISISMCGQTKPCVYSLGSWSHDVRTDVRELYRRHGDPRSRARRTGVSGSQGMACMLRCFSLRPPPSHACISHCRILMACPPIYDAAATWTSTVCLRMSPCGIRCMHAYGTRDCDRCMHMVRNIHQYRTA